jgi:O-methyltransferase
VVRRRSSRLIAGALARRGWELRRLSPRMGHADLEPEFIALYERCAPATMTSIERMYALYQAVRHVHAAAVPGDVVECGVWLGGSSMLAALTLDSLGDCERHLWLYDTFQGMPPPTEVDRSLTGEHARDALKRTDSVGMAMRAVAGLAEVKANLATTGYPSDHLRFVEGMVEDTIPAVAPEQISILRLDTDWYESTRHELRHLWPRLSPGGVLIIDDYGHWQGARRAVDEFLATVEPVLLQRIDYTGRLALKPG